MNRSVSEPTSEETSTRLVVFSDDWGRHPSSCQHLVRQLLPRYDVVWVDTIGTRPPRLDLLTMRRGFGKLRRWAGGGLPVSADPAGTGPPATGSPVTGPPVAGPPVADPPVTGPPVTGAPTAGAAPTVLSPVMWPRFRRSFERRLNAALLERSLRGALDDGRSTLGVTTIPLVADLIGRGPVDRWVYYCVDDLAAWPGLDRQTLLDMERRLVERVDQIVVVSEELEHRIAGMGRSSTLLTHGVDLGHWAGSQGAGSQWAGSARAADTRTAGPVVLFWGVVDRRLDTAWLRALAARLEGAHTERARIDLVGPANNPDPEIAAIDGVELAGPVPYDDLPELAGTADVLVMPYADMPATRAMQPLKLKEYLATDRPVVVSSLPAVAGWEDACDVAADAQTFAESVARRLSSGLPRSQAEARRRLEDETWASKAAVFEKVLLGAG